MLAAAKLGIHRRRGPEGAAAVLPDVAVLRPGLVALLAAGRDGVLAPELLAGRRVVGGPAVEGPLELLVHVPECADQIAPARPAEHVLAERERVAEVVLLHDPRRSQTTTREVILDEILLQHRLLKRARCKRLGDAVDLEDLVHGTEARVVVFSWNTQPDLVRRLLSVTAGGHA